MASLSEMGRAVSIGLGAETAGVGEGIGEADGTVCAWVLPEAPAPASTEVNIKISMQYALRNALPPPLE
jgi:hypothetical protein